MSKSNSPGFRRSGRNATGVSMQQPNLSAAVLAKAELLKFKEPKPMSHNSRSKVVHHIVNGSDKREIRYVLMDYSDGKNAQLKSKFMTRLDAWTRNESLRGTGFAWAICGG